MLIIAQSMQPQGIPHSSSCLAGPHDSLWMWLLASRRPRTRKQLPVIRSTQKNGAPKWSKHISWPHMKGAAERRKKGYDQKVRSTVLTPGERVLVRNLAPPGGPGELQLYWEETIYKVIKQSNDSIPVYVVSPENGKGLTRTLHRNI